LPWQEAGVLYIVAVDVEVEMVREAVVKAVPKARRLHRVAELLQHIE
jgi:hypothetical protein